MIDRAAAFEALCNSLIARSVDDSDAAQECFDLLSLERLERASEVTLERLAALTSNLIDAVEARPVQSQIGTWRLAAMCNLLGLVAMDGQDGRAAGRAFRRATELCPDNLHYHYALVWACLECGDIERGVEAVARISFELLRSEEDSVAASVLNLALCHPEFGLKVDASFLAACFRLVCTANSSPERQASYILRREPTAGDGRTGHSEGSPLS